jgi:predicted  nucleic acid-binding Zn-ribbon protein
MSEIGIQEKRIQQVLPRDITQAKTTEERKAIEAHNERFENLNKFFRSTMEDLSKHGPKAWVRASVEATRAMLLETEYKEMEQELKSTKAERDQFKAELDKITGARRKISHTSGTPPVASNNGKKQTGDGLSIKNLDVRDSFKNFDWGDNS